MNSLLCPVCGKDKSQRTNRSGAEITFDGSMNIRICHRGDIVLSKPVEGQRIRIHMVEHLICIYLTGLQKLSMHIIKGGVVVRPARMIPENIASLTAGNIYCL